MRYVNAYIFLLCALAPAVAMGMGLTLPGPDVSANPADISHMASVDGTANPLRISMDGEGRFYVTDSLYGKVSVYSNSGSKQFDIRGVGKPLGIASPGDGIYIADGRDGSVKVFDNEGNYLRTLGGGEFRMPGGVVVSSSGLVLVTDSGADVVRVYGADGLYAFSFGSGLLSSPIDIAISPVTGDIYVLDAGNGRVAVFDSAGNYKSSIGSSGAGSGQFTRPSGITVDSSGNIYVSDSFQSAVLAFDAAGTYLGSIGNYGAPGGSLRTPMDVAVDGLEKVFVTSLNSSRVEVFGSASSNGLALSPGALNFSVSEGGSATFAITVESLGASLDWTASSDAGWLAAGASSGRTPSGLTVGVDATGLIPGPYTGHIKVSAPGVTETVKVSLEVTPAAYVLDVVPESIDIRAQADGRVKTASIFTMGTEGLGWSVDAGAAGWLSASPLSGVVPGSSILTLDPAGMSPGTYVSAVTVSASGASGSPASIPVTLDLIDAGDLEVRTNHGLATFDITGEIPGTGQVVYSGQGTGMYVTDAPSGIYSVTFGPIAGFRAPLPLDIPVTSGRVTAVNGDYLDLRERNNILVSLSALKEGLSIPDEVKVFDGDGEPVGGYLGSVFASTGTNDSTLGKGTLTAAGDVDGDGREDIIVSHEQGTITGYSGSGVPLEGLNFRAFPYKSAVDVAVADLDGDGAAEIIAGAGKGANIPAAVRVFKYTGSGMEDTGVNFLADQEWDGVVLATGDVDGDGVPEILTVSGTEKKAAVRVRIWKVREAGGVLEAVDAGGLTDGMSYHGADIAAGDLDADGTDEVVLSLVSSTKDTLIAAYRFTGTGGEKVAEFPVASPNGANIAAGDTDFDGRAEIVACDAAVDGVPLVRVYDADGVLRGEFTPYDYRKINGLNVSMGRVTGK